MPDTRQYNVGMSEPDLTAETASLTPARRRRLWLLVGAAAILFVAGGLALLRYVVYAPPEDQVAVLLRQLRAGEQRNGFSDWVRRLFGLGPREEGPRQWQIVQDLAAIGPEAVPPLIAALKIGRAHV